MVDKEATDRTPGRNPILERLDRFIGEWELEVPLDGEPIWGGTVRVGSKKDPSSFNE